MQIKPPGAWECGRDLEEENSEGSSWKKNPECVGSSALTRRRRKFQFLPFSSPLWEEKKQKKFETNPRNSEPFPWVYPGKREFFLVGGKKFRNSQPGLSRGGNSRSGFAFPWGFFFSPWEKIGKNTRVFGCAGVLSFPHSEKKGEKKRGKSLENRGKTGKTRRFLGSVLDPIPQFQQGKKKNQQNPKTPANPKILKPPSAGIPGKKPIFFPVFFFFLGKSRRLSPLNTDFAFKSSQSRSAFFVFGFFWDGGRDFSSLREFGKSLGNSGISGKKSRFLSAPIRAIPTPKSFGF